MTRIEFLEFFQSTYQLVHVLVDKEEYKIYHFRNKKIGKDIMLRYYRETPSVYEQLVNVKSKNLPEIYDVIPIDDGVIVLEEFIKGITVSNVLESGLYNYRGAKKIIREVCSALFPLHQLGIVHRDVKPENIIVSDDGNVVLIDFNASRIVKTANKDTVIMGTVGFASPEQLGVAQSDARTDVYALGILLNVMLIGKHPSEQLAKGKAGRIVKKCTNINPEDRYQSVLDLIKSL